MPCTPLSDQPNKTSNILVTNTEILEILSLNHGLEGGVFYVEDSICMEWERIFY